MWDDRDPLGSAIIGGIALATVITAAVFAVAIAVPVLVAGAVGFWLYKMYVNSESVQLRREMEALYELYQSTKYAAAKIDHIPDGEKLADLAIVRANEMLADEGHPQVPVFLCAPFEAGCDALMRQSGLALLPVFDQKTLREDRNARNALREKLYDLKDRYELGEQSLDEVFNYAIMSIYCVSRLLPPSLQKTDGLFSISVKDTLSNPKQLTADILSLALPADGEVSVVATLQSVYDHAHTTLARENNIRPDALVDNQHRLTPPTEDKRTGAEVLSSYMRGWVFEALLEGRIGYDIDAEARFEHMHVLGGTGHGKTQLLQCLIRADLEHIVAAHRERNFDDDIKDRRALRSMVVIDSQGDLIKSIKRRRLLSPYGDLADRVIIIDPTDVEFPPALNMFDMNEDRLDGLSPRDREMIYNGTVELYVYLFGAILEADMTARQATMFRYLAQLLLAIPGATFDTLLKVLDSGDEFSSEIARLDPAAQEFFRTQFFGNKLEDVKKQLSWRLWNVRSNRALSEMFASPENKIDLGAALQRGSVILIDTDKEFLKTEGSKVFGRFWIAMLAQAALQRSVIPKNQRVDTHVYLDEAHEVIDEKVEEILNQARKYRISMCISHQNLGQMANNATRATVAASTSVKMLGGVSQADARAYAGDMRTSAEHILGARKEDRKWAEFVTFIKNKTPQALTLQVPFGKLEELGEMDDDEVGALQDHIRATYCRDIRDVSGKPKDNRAPPDSAEDEPDDAPDEDALGPYEPI